MNRHDIDYNSKLSFDVIKVPYSTLASTSRTLHLQTDVYFEDVAPEMTPISGVRAKNSTSIYGFGRIGKF